MFGGKLSTLFNAYLSDFVKGMDKIPERGHENLEKRIIELEKRIQKIEKS